MPSKETLEAAFVVADADKKGKLNAEEFKVAANNFAEDSEQKLFANDEWRAAAFYALDVDEDGYLTLEELLKWEEQDDEILFGRLFKGLVANSDKDKDGYLTSGELRCLVEMMNPEEDDPDFRKMMVHSIIKMCARDTSRKVKAEEVVSYFLNGPSERDIEEQAKLMFRMYDTNGDGFIDKKELVSYLKEIVGVEDEELSEAVKMFLSSEDEDEDRKQLNYEEFCEMWEMGEQFLSRDMLDS